MQRRRVVLGGLLVATIVALGVGQAAVEAAGNAQTVQAPRFEVDPFWPKPLPNHWLLGNVIGVGVDMQDHILIVHRLEEVLENERGLQDKLSECCAAAPPVLEFDQAGTLVRSWGGPAADGAYVWPASNHGLAVDRQNNVWIGGNVGTDSHVLKFTHDGKYLMTIGKPGQGIDSKDTTHFSRVADIAFDFAANEAYFADGYGNKRVAVVDIATGRFKRMWGAYGKPPTDSAIAPYDPNLPITASTNFRGPVHCAEPTKDGFVYVCDRRTNRIQVFRTDGTFVKELWVAPRTGGDGSTWDISFSTDSAQKYMYLLDGQNENLYIIDRLPLTTLYKLGDGGRMIGQWYQAHSIATDSRGNVYTTETYEGKRVQRFVYRGIGPVSRKDMGTPWPVSVAAPAATPSAAAGRGGTP